MKKIQSYILGIAALAAAGSMASCQDSFDDYTEKVPVASLTPNMSILELKQLYWNDATNYIDTIGIENGKDDGKEYVIAGRVISSDEAGNVFKSLVIQDKTAALALSINSYNLYLNYRIGQEIVIDLKGMYIGKYNGLVQLGMPEWYANGNAWEATFMAPEYFVQHIELNGRPEAAKIDTLEINSFSELPSNPEGLCQWQSQLVKFNNVYFQNGGEQQFSEYHSSGVNQNIVDTEGNTLPVRTSGYSNFWNQYLPEGNGDVVCLLSYYGTTGWQLLLNDYAGCMNFGNPTVAPGTEDNPYTVMDAIATVQGAKNKSGWVRGYIVGAVAPEVTSVKSDSDIEWGADVVMNNTLVIGATPDTKSIAQAMIISLPANSSLRKYGNLASHPELYKKQIEVKGAFGYFLDTYAVTGNKGTTAEFHIEGLDINDGPVAGNGTEDKPYNVAQVIAKNPQGNADAPDESNVWVRGYIVGWADMSSTYYINAETARFSVPATLATNILLADTPEASSYTECIGIQLPSGAVRSALNLMDNPANLGKEVAILGNIAKYSGVPGLRSASKYKFIDGTDTPGGDDPIPGAALYTEAFSNTQGQFVINDVSLPSGLSYVWSATANYGMKASAFANNTTYASESWLISPVFDLAAATDVVLTFDQANNKYGSASDIKTQATVWVSVDGADWQQLAVPNYGSNADWNFVNSGSISLAAYSGKKVSIGFRYSSTSSSAGTWEIKNFSLTGKGSVTTSAAVVPGGGSTPDTPDTPDQPDQPDTPVLQNQADFDTFNDGVANTMSYNTYQTASGWTAEYALILAGGTDATNFVSTSDKFLFPCLNGRTDKQGRLYSPTLAGGIKTLTFNYGFPYNETKVRFTVQIKQGGKVVASDTVDVTSIQKATPYSYTHDFNISGDFQIEIVNDMATNTSGSNKDRLAIWNLSWDN